MDEGDEARSVVIAGGLDGPPAQIVAEITSGVARTSRIDAGADSGPEKLAGMRAEQGSAGAADDGSLARAVTIGVGEQRGDGVTRAGLYPDMRRAIGKTETQNCLRPMSSN